MDKIEYEFVFGDLTVREFMEIEKAIKETKKSSSLGPILEIVDRYMIGDIYSTQMFELPNIMEQFNKEFVDYFKEMNQSIGIKHD